MAVVFILMARGWAVVGVRVVMMKTCGWEMVVVVVVNVVVAVVVMVVASQAVSSAPLTSHWRAEANEGQITEVTFF